jgi:integrase
MRFSEPQIVTSDNLGLQSYIVFYFEGKRIRVYSGKQIGIHLFPNKATTQRERLARLHSLRSECLKLLISEQYPYVPMVESVSIEVKVSSTLEYLQAVLNDKKTMKLSERYKKDLQVIYDQFTGFLTSVEQDQPLSDLKLSRVEEFLKRFASSGTYYMRRRSDLSILLNSAYRKAEIPTITSSLPTIRTKATLHQIYEKDKMLKLLDHLKEASPKLHLCCLMTYGCWLRPHIEIRNLKKGWLKNNLTEIHLAGSQNKSGRVRVVYVPDYVKESLDSFLEGLSDDDNIFSGHRNPYNKDYFTKLWERLKQDMLELKLIKNNQTIYSFRHTAAVSLYRRKKDIYLLQKLLGHSSIGVTQKYLRGLGEVNIEELRDAAPEL